MKKILYLIALVFVMSCQKEDPEPKSDPGFMERILNENQSIKIIEKEIVAVPDYGTDFGIYQGYYITPLKDIKIKALGCKVPVKGTYELIIGRGSQYDFAMQNYLYTDQISISKEGVYQFKDLNQDLILKANSSYLIVQLSKNPSTYFEAYHSTLGGNSENSLQIPFVKDDIRVGYIIYYSAYYGEDGKLYLENGEEYVHGGFKLWGLVDFKYELVE